MSCAAAVIQVILIPAYRPGPALIGLLRELRELTTLPFLVVNDGSGEEYATIFADAALIENTTVVTHAINLGKGAALKSGSNHALVTYPRLQTIVTADADGQHLAKDILAVTAAGTTDIMVMGCRRFHKDIPLRSRFGNIVSQYLYRLLTGISLSDTQTGLRSIPRKLALSCLLLRSNRYEFETEQLVTARRGSIPFVEVPIDTVYINDNASSHFNPLFDSFRIYVVLFRYAAASVATALVDFLVFISLSVSGAEVFGATMGARAVALWVQFALLQRFVFRKSGGLAIFIAYVGYVIFTGFVSSALQVQFRSEVLDSVVLGKIIVEGLIFLSGFLFLRDFVFGRDKQ